MRRLAKPVLLLAGLTASLLALRSLGADPREIAAATGQHGPGAFLLLGSLACAIGIPRQAVAAAGGFAFGFWPGGLLALLAEIVGCALTFVWARLLGRRAALRLLARREGGRLDRLDRFLTSRAFTATLTLRLLPVGSNVVLNLLAGVSGVRTAPFLAASVIGYVPQTVVFALAGDGAGVSSAVQFALAAGLMLLSVALGAILLRRRPAALTMP